MARELDPNSAGVPAEDSSLPSSQQSASRTAQGESEESLSGAFARSVRHNTIAEMLVQVVRAGGLIVLARTLDPSDFGDFKILAAVSVFAMIVCQSGLPDALIQRDQLTAEHEATGFWLTVLFAVGAGVGLCFAAPHIAVWMQMPKLRPGLLIIAAPLVIECISASPGARLRRRLNFRAIAIAEVASELAFLIAALTALWAMRAPRWSLAIGLAARFLVHGSMIWAAAGYLPLTPPRLRAIRDLRSFVFRVWLAAIVQVTSENADYFLVGRLLGSGALGYYGMAWDLLRFIPDRLHRMAGRVTLPEFCRLQHSNQRLRSAYLDFMSYVAKIVMPVLACVAIAAPQIIQAIYGGKWAPTATPVRLLAPGLLLVGLRMAIGSIYFAKNRPSFDVYLHSGRLIFIFLAVYGLSRDGIAGVSAGMSLVEAVVGIGGICLACFLIELPLSAFLGAMLPAIKVTIACALAIGLAKVAVQLGNLSGFSALAVLMIFPGAAFWSIERQSILRFAKYQTRADALALEQ